MNSFAISYAATGNYLAVSPSPLSFAFSYQQMILRIDNHLLWGPLVSNLEPSFPNISPSHVYILPMLLGQLSYYTTPVLLSTDIWSNSFFLNVYSLVLKDAFGFLVNSSFSPALPDLSPWLLCMILYSSIQFDH